MLLVFVDLVLYPESGDGGSRDATTDVWIDMGGRVNPIGEGFLIGVISTCSVLAWIFFVKFWKATHDFLFLALGAAFLIEGVNSASILLVQKPNKGHPLIYCVRLRTSLLILTAIVKKHYGSVRR